MLSPDVRFFSLEYEFLLACLDLVPQKRHHFVRTCFSTIIYQLVWAWNTFTQNLCYLEFRGSPVRKTNGILYLRLPAQPFCKDTFGYINVLIYSYLLRSFVDIHQYTALFKALLSKYNPTKWRGSSSFFSNMTWTMFRILPEPL